MGSRRTGGGTKHLRFEKMPLMGSRKLHNYLVINDLWNEEIGVIHWRGGWRQFVFRAYPEIDMTRSCHKEIDEFIDKLMVEWKEGNL